MNVRLTIENEDTRDEFTIHAESIQQLRGALLEMAVEERVRETEIRTQLKLAHQANAEYREELKRLETVNQFGAQLEAERLAAIDRRDIALEQLEDTTRQLQAARGAAMEKDKLRRVLNSEVRMLKQKLEAARLEQQLARKPAKKAKGRKR